MEHLGEEELILHCNVDDIHSYPDNSGYDECGRRGHQNERYVDEEQPYHARVACEGVSTFLYEMVTHSLLCIGGTEGYLYEQRVDEEAEEKDEEQGAER